MRDKEQEGDPSVRAIAGTHVVLLGEDSPKQRCLRLRGICLAASIRIPKQRNIRCWDMRFFTIVESFPYLSGPLFGPKAGSMT